MKPKVQPPPTPRFSANQHNSRPCDLKTDLYILQPERLNSSTPLKVNNFDFSVGKQSNMIIQIAYREN